MRGSICPEYLLTLLGRISFNNNALASQCRVPNGRNELPGNAHWQVIATGIGRQKLWDLHRRCLELGGNVRTGLEDTFYLPNGERASDNAQLVEALVKIVREVGKEVASPSEAREILGISR